MAKSFADYVAWCKANPKEAAYGTPGAGTASHFIGVMIGKAIGVPLTHVPYRGGTPAQVDLIGGHLPMLINGLADMMENHKAGKLKVVAVTGPQRSPLLPEAPTLKELGFDVAADDRDRYLRSRRHGARPREEDQRRPGAGAQHAGNAQQAPDLRRQHRAVVARRTRDRCSSPK